MSAQFDYGEDFASARERLLREREERARLAERVIPFNVSYLDDACLGIYPTDLIVMSAATGAGKTTMGTLLAQQAAADGRRVHFFALEAHRNEIEQRMLFRELAALASERGVPRAGLTFGRWMYGRCGDFAALEREAVDRLASRLAGMQTFYRAAAFTHKDITRLFLSVKEETDLIILDHLHYVDLEGPNENAELKRVIKAIRDAALDMEVPVIVVAHLRKKDRQRPRVIPETDDIHGASDISKVATKIVVLAPCRDENASRNPGVAATYVQVTKDRFSGVNGYCALMQYDLAQLEYNSLYGLARLDAAGEVVHLDQSEIPSWAKRGVGMKGKRDAE